jgi:hypothetical protein
VKTSILIASLRVPCEPANQSFERTETVASLRFPPLNYCRSAAGEGGC